MREEFLAVRLSRVEKSRLERAARHLGCRFAHRHPFVVSFGLSRIGFDSNNRSS